MTYNLNPIMTDKEIRKAIKQEDAIIKQWLRNSCNPATENDRKCIERMMIAMWARQTANEQATHTTRDCNKRGFNAVDASFAGRFVTGFHQYGQTTVKMAIVAKRLLVKYSKQLAEIKIARTMGTT